MHTRKLAFMSLVRRKAFQGALKKLKKHQGFLATNNTRSVDTSDTLHAFEYRPPNKAPINQVP